MRAQSVLSIFDLVPSHSFPCPGDKHPTKIKLTFPDFPFNEFLPAHVKSIHEQQRHYLQASMTGHELTHENAFFFIDPYPTRPHHKPVTDNALIGDTGAQSDLDSSEDEVIFSGRQTAQKKNITSSRVHPQSTAPVVVKVVEDDVQFLSRPDAADRELSEHWKGTASDNDHDQARDDLYIGLSTNNRKARKRARNRQKRLKNDEDDLYIEFVRNISRQDDSSNDDQVAEDDRTGQPSKDKARFRALSSLEMTGESSMQAEDNADKNEDEESSEDSDDADLEELLSHIRRGASFTMLEESWASSNELSLEGESFVDFDLIDMQRSGPLKNKKKKGRHQLDFGLSDSDLEIHLEQAWEKDRNKKAAKKREREKLRAEGLLGKKSKKAKESAFGMEGLKVELKKFLQSQSDSLDLPPMKKQHRRLVHELANALMLKSQSRGHGSDRFPVLYKTGRTPNFNGKHSVKLDKILAQPRFNQRQNARMSPSNRGREREPEPKNNRRRPNASASYLEGEVVGGSAPEIGANNKGRAMLEKMGWSTGTALGALNNKGILQPVSQVVKNTRAGLG